jgi:hypothetical protein
VWARDVAGNWSNDAGWRYFECPDITPPPAPAPLSPGTNDPNNPQYKNCPWVLDWTPVSDPSGVVYYVLLEFKPWNQNWKEEDHWYPVYDSQLTVSHCAEYLAYRWRVIARDGAGNWSNWSEYLYHHTTVW